VDRCRRLGVPYSEEPRSNGAGRPGLHTAAAAARCRLNAVGGGSSQSPGDDERAPVGGGHAGVNVTVGRPVGPSDTFIALLMASC